MRSLTNEYKKGITPIGHGGVLSHSDTLGSGKTLNTPNLRPKRSRAWEHELGLNCDKDDSLDFFSKSSAKIKQKHHENQRVTNQMAQMHN